MSSVIKRPSLGPRVRGLRIRELPREKLLSVIYANTLEEFLNVLKTTTYSVTLDRLTRENLSELRKNLIKIYIDRIKSIFLGSSNEVKLVILQSIKYFEYENIRNLSIAIKAGKSPEDFLLWEPLEFSRRRHVIAGLLGAKNLEEIGERLRQMRHPAYKAFDMAFKYGEDKLSIFLDRQWVEDFSTSPLAEKDKTLRMFTADIKEYFNTLIALRARIWGLTEELGELIIGKPTPIVQSAVRDPPTRFLENAEAAPWGKILLDMVAEAPSLENIAVAMDNIYPAYIKRLSDIYTARFSEFSLGALAAHLEYMRAEVLTLIRAASLLAEGVPAEKRRKIFEPLTR
ncbi:V-type ATPase subunit [Pyrobaculum aerophilum]|uniref:H+-transporting ATP synthase subunit C (AtpC) n=2 Tax=Pyrobaculum aerophilum TaxID=13773 RepID=Q8ZYI8_PYRAE|nr:MULTISPECIES: V-type ATPase subunit [Pyrobaculum]AAL63005.1 H+-transporting ATP synthase subunit C (atpC) [Pyrobaculum aerophilum str. IM2]MCX8136200.1 V-type ATPase subunit [Pyrobaculum aerophilum]RFA97426.1 ATPase [Pyrobaculum aerophilum]RFA97489.1 ATPase [Pyrobaculum aerophilum]HII48224.1 ATPase [Pyrobaculum aerophilum]